MKSITYIFPFITLFLTYYLQANAKNGIVDGYYITLSGDTVKGVFILPYTLIDHELKIDEMQNGINFIEQTSGTEFYLKPTKINECFFILNNYP